MEPASGKAARVPSSSSSTSATNPTGPKPAGKPGRSRAACAACRAVKQRCDGVTRHPCRRCELYGLLCEYPGMEGQGVVGEGSAARPSNSQADGNAGTGPALLPRPPSSFLPPPSTPTTSSDPGVAAALREIKERLRQIETGLENDRRARAGAPSVPQHAPSQASGSSSRRLATAASPRELVDLPFETNPLQVLEQTIDKIEAMSVAKDSPPGWRADEGSDTSAGGGGAPPDAIIRGLVSLADCEAAFAFFHERIQPWILIMGNSEDRLPTVVQSRSSFLFHAILLVTNYYNTSTTDRAKETYRGLVDIVNTLLANHILCPEPAHINIDFVRGLLLLLYYKPVQEAAYNARGITDMGRIVHASKVSSYSSLMLQGFIHRTADIVGLPRAPAEFLAASSNTPSTVTSKSLSDLRVHYWLCCADMLGSLQSGRHLATDPSLALQTTRSFAALKAQPCDPRRAATLEVYAIARTPPGADPALKRLSELGRINDELDEWETYWKPILSDAQNAGDPLAYTVVQNLSNFVTFTSNSAVFTRWTLERQHSLEEGGDGRPALSSSDWAHLQRAADAAQKFIFAVSTESTGHPLRACNWPPSQNGYREPLTLDPRTVEDYRTALDTATCISFIYSLLLLVRMASAGLISCELLCRRIQYENGADINVPQPLGAGAKLPRLLELGSEFLYAIAPNSHHPARKHSVLLRMILEAGLSEDTPHPSPPSVVPAQTTPTLQPAVVNPQLAQPLPPLAPTSLPVPAPSLDAWLWDGSSSNLTVSSDGRSLLIPAAPGPPDQPPGAALATILGELGSYYGGEASIGDELDFAAMDWGQGSGL